MVVYRGRVAVESLSQTRRLTSTHIKRSVRHKRCRRRRRVPRSSDNSLVKSSNTTHGQQIITHRCKYVFCARDPSPLTTSLIITITIVIITCAKQVPFRILFVCLLTRSRKNYLTDLRKIQRGMVEHGKKPNH